MNNAQWELLLKLIVPAIFVLSWVFKQAVDPDSKMPKMPQKRGGPQPSRPPVQPTVRGNPTTSRSGAGEPARPSPRPEPLTTGRLSSGQEMVIVGSETRTTRSAPTPTRDPRSADRGRNDRQGRGGRGKPSGGRSASGRSATGSEALIGRGSLTEPGGLVDRPTYIGPLTTMDGASSLSSDAGVAHTAALASQPNRSSEQFRELLHDPSRLREAFVLNEILQPPVAQRRRGLRR
jgi:hypothetical protein